SFRAWNWMVVGPHSGASLVYPVLPTDVFDFNVAATDSSYSSFLVLGKVPGGYDVVRAIILGGDPTSLVTGPTGSFVYETLAPIGRTVPHAQHPRPVALSHRRL